MNILVTAIPADQFFADPIALPVFADVFPPRREAGRVDFRLAGLISTWIKDAVVDPSSHDPTLFMPGTPDSFPMLVISGAGACSALSAPGQERIIAGMIETLLRARVPLFGLAARDFKKPLTPARDSAEIILRGLAHGADLADIHSGHTIRLHWDADEADLLASELRRFRFHVPSCREWTIDRAPEDAEWLGAQ
ncbi:MAG TPA: hypothetical protein VM658_20185 [bacterium]|nr:hypothetical protein [bacterium]